MQRLVSTATAGTRFPTGAKPHGQCDHNLNYWRDGDWWGAGPGAHSHMGDRRFFNVKHPATYATTLAAGKLPVKESETLSAIQRHEEQVMLGLRLRQGLPASYFNEAELMAARGFAQRGLLVVGDRVALTAAGRLLADGLITDILVAGEKN